MTTPFVLAVPSKGRLQENTEAFFARAGLALAKPRGVREYRGTISGLDNVEIAYLSASEIASQLARGAVHLGVTGEDLVRESIADADKRVAMIDNLGFGNANVVVAVPQAWIDVRTMADLDDVTTGFRAQHNRRMRVATKYINLTRTFFASHGVVDYRIVESAGATEGDGWVDAKGMFLAAAGAGPVYRLLGKKDMGTTQFPPIETALIEGDVAFRQHTGGHTPAPNWPTFITFAGRYLKEPAPLRSAR